MNTTTLPDPTPVVIDIDDTVDVIPVPAHLAARAAELVPPDRVPVLLELIALLIARLGDHAEPTIRAWMDYTPSVLTDFPAALRDELVDGRIGAPRGATAPLSRLPG